MAAADEIRYRLTVERGGQARAQEPVRITCSTLSEAISHGRDVIRCAEHLRTDRTHGAPQTERAAYAAQLGAALRELEDIDETGGRVLLPNRTALTIDRAYPFVVAVAFGVFAPDAETAFAEIGEAFDEHDRRALFSTNARTATVEDIDCPSFDGMDILRATRRGPELLRDAPRWKLVRRWTDNAYGVHGDDARGDAYVTLYRAGRERCEISYYVAEREGGTFAVATATTTWTEDYRGTDNDDGRDVADIRYETAETRPFATEAEAQQRAAELGTVDEADTFA